LRSVARVRWAMRIVLLAVLAATPAATAAASDAEPVIYIFWSASCPVSEVRVRDFEVDHEATT
jgi:hypothetical protein